MLLSKFASVADLLSIRQGIARAALIVAGVAAGGVLAAGCSRGAGGGAPAAEAASQISPEEALAACDRLASAPGDPLRAEAAVTDEAFAPAPALAACADAVAQNADSARAHFEYGRSLAQSGRDADAYEEFKTARLAGYPAASLALANAYRDGRLPSGEQASLATAVTLYEEAANGGVGGADKALADARLELERATFDKSLFQNGDYMAALYTGDYSNIKQPLALVYYMQGVASGFEDSNVIFMDQACKALVSKAGLDLIRNADGPVSWAQILAATDPSGKWSPAGLVDVLAASAVRSYVIDMGERDATVLYGEGRYGCKSPVTRQVLSHMMLVVKNTH